VRQLLTESVVLASCGGVLGLAVGGAGARLASALLKDAFGITGNIGLDMRVVAVTAAAALATSVIFGLLPAVYATRVEPRDTLVEFGNVSIAGTARHWPRRLIVVSEVALSVMLLVGAGLLIRTFDHLTRLRPGFDGTHVMTATLSLQDARYRTSARVNQLVDRTLARMHEIPGVDRAAVALTLPYERALNVSGRWVGAKPGAEQVPLMNLTYVSPEYFEALRVPLVRGRVFTPLDTAIGSTVIIVNEAFVRRSSPDEQVLGRQIVVAGRPRTVIAVVGDIQQKWSFGNYGPIAAVPASYIPVAQTNDAFLTLMNTWFAPSWFVRTSGPQQGIVPAMQRAVASVDPMLPFAKFRTLDNVRADAVATERARATLLATFAGLALLLAGIGLYGLVASSIAERTRELGIRVALGATPSRAIATVAAPGLVLAAAGIVVGLVAARAGAQMVRHLVWGISVGDATTFTIAAVGVAVVATIATLAPSLRIARLNPIQALRM
jgi:predicted permease